MKIIYIISGYKLPEQFIRLVNRLGTDDCTILIHIDKKTDARIYAHIQAALKRYSNIYFLDRHVCRWGDFGHVRATLKGIQKIVDLDLPGEYVILLTGQDYPIKSNSELQTFLHQSRGRSYIDFFPIPAKNWGIKGGLERLAYFHWHILGRHFSWPIAREFKTAPMNKLMPFLSNLIPFTQKVPGDLKLFCGSSYWCLSRVCVEYVHKFISHNTDYEKFFMKHVNIPDEMFFQTILLNSEFKDQLVNTTMTYVDWTRPTPPYPAILGQDDYDALIKTEHFFARKFDNNVDARILDLLDERNTSIGSPVLN